MILPVSGFGTGSPIAAARAAGEKRIDSRSQWFIFFTLLIGKAENQHHCKTIEQNHGSVASHRVTTT